MKITMEALIKVDSNISVVLKRSKLKLIRKEILSKFKSLNQFAKTMNSNLSTIHSILIGKNNPTFLFLKKVLEKLDIRWEDVIKKIIARNQPNGCFLSPKSLPLKASKELSSLVAHAFGDGHVRKDGFEFTNNCKMLVKNVIRSAKKIGLRNVSVSEWFHKARTIRLPKLLRNILILAGAPEGNKTLNSFQLPSWIKSSSKEIKKSFLQSLFDDEATVQIDFREIVLSMHKNIRKIRNLTLFFEEIKAMLKEFGIEGVTLSECHPHEGKNGKTLEKRLRICGTFNFIKFQREINFSHPHKKALLKIMIKNTKRFQFRRGETKELIINVLKRGKKLTTSEIARQLKISHWCAWDHLNDLRKEGKVILEKRKFFNIWSLNSKNN